jgi:hypothetical protein
VRAHDGDRDHVGALREMVGLHRAGRSPSADALIAA